MTDTRIKITEVQFQVLKLFPQHLGSHRPLSQQKLKLSRRVLIISKQALFVILFTQLNHTQYPFNSLSQWLQVVPTFQIETNCYGGV